MAEPKRPTLLRIRGRGVYVVDRYDARPAENPANLLVDLSAYSAEHDETIDVTLELPRRSDDPSEPLWPESDAAD